MIKKFLGEKSFKPFPPVWVVCGKVGPDGKGQGGIRTKSKPGASTVHIVRSYQRVSFPSGQISSLFFLLIQVCA